jgi:hypothetical protein
MRSRVAATGLVILVSVVATAASAPIAGPIPPGRQYRLSIAGENTVTFVPQAGLPPLNIDYKARIEYIVNTRFGKETKPSTEEAPPEENPAEEPPTEKVSAKSKGSSSRTNARSKANPKKSQSPASNYSGAVDLALHSSEMTIRQGGQPVLETRLDRNRLQGRLAPEAPVMNVTARDAPLIVQEILKRYDTVWATMSINDDYKEMGRKFRYEGPMRAVTETILSIHTPIPKGADSWESPTQLAMGHGQTAKGKLRFEKIKPAATAKGQDAARSTDVVTVKVSGVLKAEGVVAGRFIKDGTYTVTGEQTYDMHTKEWIASTWSVVVANDLVNQTGQTVAQARGTMTVTSTAVVATGATESDKAVPKL